MALVCLCGQGSGPDRAVLPGVNRLALRNLLSSLGAGFAQSVAEALPALRPAYLPGHSPAPTALATSLDRCAALCRLLV
jgi:hypothetical protein